MSDREESAERQENGSHRSNDGSNRSVSRHGSESPRRSRTRSRSPRQTARSRSRSPRKRSHSRSRSHSRRYSRHRREHSKSRSRSPRNKKYPRDRRSPLDNFDRRTSRYGNSSGYHSEHKSRGDGHHRDHSRSPMSSRRRHVGNRENPPTGRCLGIFGLSIYTQERDLKDVFAKYGPIEDVQIVYDAQSGRSRGFAFVYYEDRNDAQLAKERCNGIEIDGRKIRVDFSITQRAHTPTPGIYMGKPTYAPRYRGGGSGREGRREYGGGYERSPSPYNPREKRARYSRSRSRSHSPRVPFR
jgi:transformer-2 protein